MTDHCASVEMNEQHLLLFATIEMKLTNRMLDKKSKFQRTVYGFMFFLQSSKITKTEQFLCIKIYDFKRHGNAK